MNAEAKQPTPTLVDELVEALRDLMRGYVNTLENGRDRILMLGGQCDSMEVMKRSDPHLRAACAALSRATAKGEVAAHRPPEQEGVVTKAQALRDLALIEDIWELAPELPYTRRLRQFIAGVTPEQEGQKR